MNRQARHDFAVAFQEFGEEVEALPAARLVS